jgi:hypothetical protein
MTVSKRSLASLVVSFTSVLAACGGTSSPAPTAAGEPVPAATGLPPDVMPGVDRPEMTAAECEAKGAELVGDIGDGAIHRPEYSCPSGSKPIGRVALGIEGSVCCPKGS